MSPYLAELRDLVGNRLLLLPSAAAVLHDPQGRVLIVLNTSGQWSLPGGLIDPGESPREAVVREVKEETGLDVIPVALVDVLGGLAFRGTLHNGHEVEAVVCVFRCQITGGNLSFDGIETTEGRWISPHEAQARFSPRFPPSIFAPPQ